MRNILIAAVALSAISAPAFAQEAEVDITATVAASCSATTNGTNINLAAISTGQGTLVPAAITGKTSTIGGFVCNGAATKVNVSAGRLIRTSGEELSAGAITAGFSTAVNYTATLTLAGFTQMSAAGVSDSSVDNAGGTEGNLGLTVATSGTITLSAPTLNVMRADATPARLVAGGYASQVIVIIEAKA
jgi:hypothetical protein